MEKLVQRGGIDAQKRFLLVDQAFADEFDGQTYAFGDRAPGDPRLKQEELAVADHEVDFHEIAEMGFENLDAAGELGDVAWKAVGGRPVQFAEIDGRCALDILQKVAGAEQELAGQP